MRNKAVMPGLRHMARFEDREAYPDISIGSASNGCPEGYLIDLLVTLRGEGLARST